MQAAPEQTPAGHLPVRPEWLAQYREEALEPDLPIVDAHHHLWDHRTPRYLLPELLEDLASGHDVRATVFMQCGAMYRAHGDPLMRPVGEVEFANGVAAMSASGLYGPSRVCAGIVGYADLRAGRPIRAVLEAEIRAGGGRFRGVRNISAWHPDPAARGSIARPPEGLTADPGFREGFACLAPLGLSFDAWMYHTQLGELHDLAASSPDTTIVLNHVGGPIGIGPYAGRREEVFEEWSAGIRRLARHANLVVKLGGLGMRLFGARFHEGERPPSSEQLAEAWRPYVETCIAAFGPERCMFESNFPVDKGTCSYGVLWNAFKRITAGCSAQEKAALYRDTAARVYRLELPS